jgi:hypothetical protein
VSLAAALALSVALVSQGLGRIRQAEVELRGPLAALEVELPGQASTRLELGLAPGELRTVSVPVFAGVDGAELVLRELPEQEGSARWVGWTREGEAELAEHWRALPSGLRTRPAVARGDGVAGREPQPAALVFSAALLVLALALRRRPALACAVGVGGGVALVLWLASAAATTRELRVLEGEGDGPWLAWDSGFDSLVIPAALPLQVEVEPRSASVQAFGALSAAGVGELTLVARGALLRRASAVDPGPRRVSASVNGWGAFEEVWLRSGDGRWTAHGPWEAGAALPAGRPGDPPGALNPALPQGVTVLVARLAPGVFSAGAPAGRPVWLRWIGPEVGDSGLPR